MPRFKSAAEEADWLASPAGHRHSERTLRRALRAGVIVTEERKDDPKLRAEAKRTGKVIRYKKGLDIKPTDPAVLQEFMERVKAKQTQAVSLRIPVSDIEAAKKIAEQKGLGYQTVLKGIISKGLRHS
jgi:predicted DNA binding CopG/RHH family protein